MRIDDLNRTPVTSGPEKSGQTAPQRSAESDAVAVSGQDQADVSHLAQSLAAADPSRIEQLRLQVESGTYEVPAQSVASSLIDAHLKM
jgi:flagellar biosynthesis anti-sigma factor FlgM